jgi:transglutaminase-like putative cysteine protease
MITAWVRGALVTARGATTIQTTAAEALALGKGVCQDYAHLMLAVCRICRLPARYVSGHLLGEGHTHAWVEVLVPDASLPGSFRTLALDPSRNRAANLSYITVAIGRDYGDVAPTRGSYQGAYAGKLTATKRAEVMAVE